MREKAYHLYLRDEERRQIIAALIEMRNKLLAQGSYTDAVDDVLCKMTAAKRKKIKIIREHGMT